MATVRFYLEKRKDVDGHIRRKNVPILAYFSFEGKRLQLTTGERINFSDWDFQEQRAYPDSKGAKQLNNYLQSLAAEILDIYRGAKTIGMTPGVEFIREQIKYRRRRDTLSFFDVFMRFINENYSNWSIHTFRKIKTNYNHLRKFSESEEIEIEFNRIDKDFLDRYVRFFKIKYGHSNNTIAKNLDVLKWFLNWSADNGFNKSMIYKDYQLEWICKPRIDQADLVLEWDELINLKQFTPDRKVHTEVRDLFCFMCFTGLKLSRVNDLKSSNIFPTYIRIQVNSSFQNLPINEYAYEIVSKYLNTDNPDERCFKYFRHPDFNRNLKQLAKDAGINSFVTLEIYSGPEKGTRQVQKHSILSSKVAVNTFLFHALRLGISSEVLSFITASKTTHGVERIRPLLEHATYNEIRKFNALSLGDKK
jgi:integrase